MIKENEVIVRLNSRNKSYYERYGYNWKHNKEIHVPIYLLSKGNHTKITAICPICKQEKSMEYKTYFMLLKRNGVYKCKKCAIHCNEIDLLYRTGYSNYFQIPEIKDKICNTNYNKYGVNYYSQTAQFKAQISGQNNHFYIDGRSNKITNRHTKEYDKWREQVLDNFNHQCYRCRATTDLQTHHIYSWCNNPEIDYHIDNGIVLCKCCHTEFHSQYWKLGGGNTYEELIHWLQETSTDYRNDMLIRDIKQSNGVE